MCQIPDDDEDKYPSDGDVPNSSPNKPRGKTSGSRTKNTTATKLLGPLIEMGEDLGTFMRESSQVQYAQMLQMSTVREEEGKRLAVHRMRELEVRKEELEFQKSASDARQQERREMREAKERREVREAVQNERDAQQSKFFCEMLKAMSDKHNVV